MKRDKSEVDELRSEYKLSDFKDKGIRGKYVKRFRAGTNLARLDTDVAAAFPTDKSVNEALRVVMQAAVRSSRLSTRSSRTTRKRSAV